MYVVDIEGDWMCRTVWMSVRPPSPRLAVPSSLDPTGESAMSWRGLGGRGCSVVSLNKWMKESSGSFASTCWENSWRGWLPVEENSEMGPLCTVFESISLFRSVRVHSESSPELLWVLVQKPTPVVA